MGIQINGQTDTVTATDGSINVGGDVTIPGVLTYEDVTNVDSVGIVTAQAGIRVTGGSIGIQKSNPLGKLHVYTNSLNADNEYNGQNFGIVVETEDGNNDGDEGNGICFTQQYSADGIDSSKVRTGAIIGYKAQASGNFGGGLKFKVQPYGASPLRTSMVLDRSGNIGINTTTPVAPLEIQGVGGVNDSRITFTRHGTPSNNSVIGELFYRIGTDSVAGMGAYRESAMDDAYLAFYTQPTSGSYGERLRIKSDGDVYIGNIAHSNEGGANSSYRTLTLADTTNGAQLHVRGQSPKLFLDVTNSGNGEIYYDTGDLRILSGEPGGTSSERIRITNSGHVGIGTDTPADILHLRNNAPVLTSEATNASSGLRVNILGQTTDTTQLFRVQDDGTTKFTVLRSGNVGVMDSAPSSLLSISQTNGNAKLQIKRSNTANNTDDYGSILWRSSGGTAVGGINVARETAENDGYMFFQTTQSGSNMTERLRILSNGTIRKGAANSAIGKQPIELFFQKRSTQIGKRIHQGSGSSATTHNILNIDSWQSANSHAFIYVTVYYVSPVANYGGRMECYATAVNSGGNVSGGQGTFVTADAGRWGNPGTPSLSWSGSTLRFNTFAHAYIDYSLDITCIAYDGAVVSFYSN
jgi:hypothetical protein